MDGSGFIRVEDGAKAAARAAQLRYVSDKKPGISRHRKGDGFCYRRPDGGFIRDGETLRRIKRLAIPPAWEEVWICPEETGHIQAVGRDARRRKQYRYHPRWREVRDGVKFDHILAFARKLPLIRARVADDIGLPGMPREKVLATVVRLLETTLIRVGNDEYARANGSYGLTTLRNRHATVTGRKVVFNFKGKSGIKHSIDLEDPLLARIVEACQELPGQELFRYVSEDGEVRSIGSTDVNEYLREIAGDDVTAKDFRTWAATTLAVIAFESFAPAATKKALKSNVRRAVEAVAEMLGNTATVCRKCYVHPAIVEGYLDGSLRGLLGREAPCGMRLDGLKPEEIAVMSYLTETGGKNVKRTRRATRKAPASQVQDRPAR